MNGPVIENENKYDRADFPFGCRRSITRAVETTTTTTTGGLRLPSFAHHRA